MTRSAALLSLLLPSAAQFKNENTARRGALLDEVHRYIHETGDGAFGVELVASVQNLGDVLHYRRSLREVNRLFAVAGGGVERSRLAERMCDLGHKTMADLMGELK